MSDLCSLCKCRYENLPVVDGKAKRAQIVRVEDLVTDNIELTSLARLTT